MRCRSRKLGTCPVVSKPTEGRDGLSELPEEVLIHILSFLPILDAVRTVRLRLFGNPWKLLRSFDIRLDSFTPLSPIDKVLLHHERGTIDNFALELERRRTWIWISYEQETIDKIQIWIKFALCKNVKSLRLSFPLFFHEPKKFPLPDFIFTSQSVVELELSSCEVGAQKKVHMPSLKALKLDKVILDKEIFEQIISGCPSLREIYLRGLQTMFNLTFSAPSIEKLTVCGWLSDEHGSINCPSLKKLELYGSSLSAQVIDLSSVREAAIHPCTTSFELHHFENPDNNGFNVPHLRGFLESLQNVKIMDFSCSVVEAFAYYALKKIPFPRNRWKRVVLKTTYCEGQLLGICCLVRNSPCLEDLVICDSNWDALALRQGRNRIPLLRSPPSVAPHLKRAEIHWYSFNVYDHPARVQLIKFLLESGVVLEKLLICNKGRKTLNPRQEVSFSEKLSSFPRASENAKIILL